MQIVYSYVKGTYTQVTQVTQVALQLPAVNWTGLKPPSLRTFPRTNVAFGLLLDYFWTETPMHLMHLIFWTRDDSGELIQEKQVSSDFVIPELPLSRAVESC